MPITAIMPIGVVETSVSDTTRTFLRLKTNHNDTQLDTPVLICNYKDGVLVKARGVITELTKNVGSLMITETNVPDTWPSNYEPFGPGNAIYIAKDEGFEPMQKTEYWIQSIEQLELLYSLAKDHEQEHGIGPAYASINAVEAPLLNGDFTIEEHR